MILEIKTFGLGSKIGDAFFRKAAFAFLASEKCFDLHNLEGQK